MGTKGISASGKSTLRNTAESRLKSFPRKLANISSMSKEEIIHEVEVYYAELEMQNEELRSALERLEESRDQYADLFDNAPSGYFVIDNKGLIENANLTGCAMLGVERNYLIGKPFSHYIRKEFQDEFYYHKKQLLESDQPVKCELQLNKKDKTVLHVQLESMMTKDESGKLSHFRTTVTEQKSNSFFKVMDQSLNEIYVIDSNTWEFKYVNFGARENLGYSVEELKSMTPLDLKPKFNRSSFLKHINLLKKGKKSIITFETIHLRKDKSTYPVEVHLQATSFLGQPVFLAVILDITERKKTEEKIKSSEERFRTLYEENPLMNFTLGDDGKVISVNKRGAVELGYSVEELTGKSVLQVFYAQDHKIVVDQINECISNPGKTFSWNLRKVTKTGETIWVSETGTALLDQHGKHIVIVVCENISERKIAEQAIKESEERFRTYTEGSPVAIWMMQEGNFIYTNPELAKITGYSQQELNGMRFDEIVHPDEVKPMKKRMANRVAGKETANRYDLKVIHKNGKLIISEAMVTLIHVQGRPAILGCAINITERKKAETELLENQRFLTMLISNLPGYAYRVKNDKNYTPEFISEGVVNITGYKQSEYLSDRTISCGQEIVPEDEQRVWDEVQKALKNNKSYEITYRIQTKKGEIKWVHETGRGVTNDKGSIIALEGFVEDITDGKKSEQELKSHTAQLEALTIRLEKTREDEQKRLAQEIHDVFGQELTSIKIGLSYVQRQLTKDTLEQKKAKMINDKIETLISQTGRTMEGVRKLSYNLRPSIIDDLGLISALEWVLLNFRKENSIRTIFSADDTVKQLKFNPDFSITVYRVMMEALTNILRHAKATRVTVNIFSNGNNVCWEIKDNGVGIDLDRTKGKGTLGVFGIRERVRHWKGELIISCEKGTKLTVSFPLLNIISIKPA